MIRTVRSATDGTQLAVDVTGDAAAPAIVLLHAIPLDRSTWDAQAERLARRARVIRFDHRGLGGSEVPKGPYLMETLAGDLADVLDATGVAKAVVVGHSLGGFVTYAFYRMFAERVMSLGIVQSRASADTPEQIATREALADRIEREGVSALDDAFVPDFLARSRYTEDPEMGARLRALVRATNPRGAAAMLRGMATRTASHDLFPEIAVPTTIVAGTADAFTSPDELRSDAAAIAGATYELLPCGHLPQWEAPQALGDVLERLLDAAIARA